MKKSKAIIVLLIMVLLIGGLGYTTAFGIGSEKTGAAEGIKLGLDLAGGVSITYQVKGDKEPSSEDMSDTIYKLQKRVEGYSTEAQVYQEGSDRINIEIPGVSDANAVLEELGKPGSLYFVDEEGNTVVEGTQVKSATAVTTNDSTTGSKDYAVDLVLTEEGSKAFAEATAKAAPEKKKIYIYYDDALVSAPTVQSEITGGEAYITNMESFEAAEQLASTIRIGGLKLELEELRSNVVGAQLGSTAIQTSLKAGVIGFVIVALFMIVVYLIPGLASAIALTLYVIFILLFLKGFDLTLTLPGIAGIILSIGMAVDANVIIFARIREEITSGKTVKSAIKIGFEKALSAIIDGNITTLIAAFVLAIKGTGSVKGFAQTLALGIVLSMFTALFITKLIINAFYALGIQDIKLYGQAKNKKTINFLSKKVLCFTISIVLVLSGFVFMGLNQSKIGSVLNYSLEFMGGTSTNVTFNEDLSIEELESDVVPLIENITGDGFIQKSKVADTNEVIFKTRTLTVDEREKFNTAMEENFSVSENMITTETISSTISSEMKADAIIAVLIATICMLIYIWFRFKDIRFAASAVLALCHDVLVVLAFYAIVKVPVGGTFIACMLTIVGYSINATIVIFDRIRENLNLMRKEELSTIVNTSISQTLSRSIFTSLTTFIMVAVLYILGVTSIKEFALPLMVGIVCGTYSSVCITGALWYVMKTKLVKKKSK
ncbi:MAG: protein translocase subunit SecD [Lachnospiraceae bacterium]|nr:protein translocase subunit SecD [Lachnospiraceae bacterium]